jgi:mRNA interferase HigB
MIVVGRQKVEAFFADRKGHKGIASARSSFEAWLAIVRDAAWETPEDVKRSHPKASILKAGRVVFNIKANDFRLVSVIQYQASVVTIRFFGTHEEYDRIDAETI